MFSLEDSCPEECPVCLEALNRDVIVLPCGHKFCKSCIDRWIQECRQGIRFDTDNVVDGQNIHIENQSTSRRPECPLCRQPFTM